MVHKLKEKFPDMAERIRALPRDILVGDLYSGSGAFGMVASAMVDALLDLFPGETQNMKVTSLNNKTLILIELTSLTHLNSTQLSDL